MKDTKEKILTSALRLFARQGYDAVSVSDIASELGITKGALYKHYKNKQDIFDSIVKRMYAADAEQSQKHSVPQSEYEKSEEGYDTISAENVRNFTVAQFKFWTENEFASNFRKMLTLEQYKNPEIAELYKKCLTDGPVSYTEDIFREMAKRGDFKRTDARQAALEFYAPFYLLISLFDNSEDGEKLSSALISHIDRFFRENLTNAKN